MVASPDTVFPDRILPSTGNVTDFEGADVLVEECDATYVMDRGVACHKRMNRWAKEEISFIVRIKEKQQVMYLSRSIIFFPKSPV
ncbi:hypothetical protein B4113_1603 [Geobacillus sp. B4113_201601]|nr:hypothetical protein B4113_1603 [Geobacillus sp. B4113_201601]